MIFEMGRPKKSYSVSALRTFSSCHRLYFWQYGMRITPVLEPIAFVVGRAWQNALISTYVQESEEAGIETIKDAFDLAVRTRPMSSRDAEELEKIRAATIGMLKGFAATYLKRDLRKWEFIEFEREFRLKMPGGRIFHGFIDTLIRLIKNRSIWVIENKTSRSIDQTHIERPFLDTQDRGYFYASCRFLDKKPKGVLHFVARKSALRGRQNESLTVLLERITNQYTENPGGFFLRKFIKFGPEICDLFELEFVVKTEEIEHCWKMFPKRGPGAFSQNPEYCFTYNRCPFWILCTKGVSKETMAGFIKRKEMR